jgi:hypothetical protein
VDCAWSGKFRDSLGRIKQEVYMPEPGSTEELKAAALTAECEVEASFAQLAHVVNPWRSKPKFAAIPAAPGRPEQPETFLTTDQGICTGLCATWLDLLAKGEESTFIERMSGLDVRRQRTGPELFVDGFSRAASCAGCIPVTSLLCEACRQSHKG